MRPPGSTNSCWPTSCRPVGGGRLSQNVSQQEYSRLFEATAWARQLHPRPQRQQIRAELASQYGTFGGTSYSLDLDYQHNDGVRPNNDLNRIEWYTTIKQQITPQDTLLVLIKYQDYHSGDNFQYYDPDQRAAQLPVRRIPAAHRRRRLASRVVAGRSYPSAGRTDRHRATLQRPRRPAAPAD